MAYGKQVRTAARTAYVYSRLNSRAIARRLKVPHATICRWRQEAKREGDDWDKARAAYSLAGEGAQATAVRFLEDFNLLLSATVDDIKAHEDMAPSSKVEALSRLADAYNKAMAAVRRAQPELSELAIAMDVLQRLAKFVQGRYPQHGKALLEIIEPFGVELAKQYG